MVSQNRPYLHILKILIPEDRRKSSEAEGQYFTTSDDFSEQSLLI